jgi:hypothetical protein
MNGNRTTIIAMFLGGLVSKSNGKKVLEVIGNSTRCRGGAGIFWYGDGLASGCELLFPNRL